MKINFYNKSGVVIKGQLVLFYLLYLFSIFV